MRHGAHSREEYKKLKKDYHDGKISKEEFLRKYRDPKNYKPELPKNNRSHRFEKSREYMENIHQLVRLKENDKIIENYAKADLQSRNEYGQTLLHEAVAFSNYDIIRYLKDSGIDLDAKDHEGKVALHYAVEKGDSHLTILLIQLGSNVNIADDFGNNTMWKATFNARGDYEIVKIVKQAGGDVNHVNNSGRSAMDFAKQIDDRNLIDLLS